MGQRKLLGESRVRRFMELAGNSRHASKFINENLNTNITEEELQAEMNELDVGVDEEFGMEEGYFDEGEAAEGIDPLTEEEEEEMAPEEEPDMEAPADEDVDVTVDEEQVASLRTAVEVLNSIIEASESEAGDEEEDAPEGEDDPMAGMDMDAAPGEEGGEDDAMAGMDAAPGEEGEEEPEMAAESIERITKRVLDRVTKRLVQEALKR